MGKLRGVEWSFAAVEPACDACGMNKERNRKCCKDVATLAKISDAHKQATVAEPKWLMADAHAIIVATGYLNPIFKAATLWAPAKSQPPPLFGVDWQSFYNVFRC
ncbi:MAG: hypothetical protein EAY75_01050 [Bacteroidetes bacterium]|nr:MAG: hypothetical protein EAY75_01050 [Bacteroidota bacterium]